jgi:hypothetical protein
MSFLHPTPVGYLYHKHFKLMDTSTLNQKIADLGAKTDKDSITPDSLASLLSELSSLLDTLQSDMQASDGSLSYDITTASDTIDTHSKILSAHSDTIDTHSKILSAHSDTIDTLTAHDNYAYTEQLRNETMPDLRAAITALQTSLNAVRATSAKGVEQAVASGSYTNLENFLNNLRVAAETGQTHVEQMKQGVFPTALSDRLTAIDSAIADAEASGGLIPLSMRIDDGQLRLFSPELTRLVDDYTPYLFRLCRHRNRIGKLAAGTAKRGHHRPTKGWHLFGGPTAAVVDASTGVVSFSKADHSLWHIDCSGNGYAPDAELLVTWRPYEDTENPLRPTGRFGWGNRTVEVNPLRMVRMPFAIGFGETYAPEKNMKITPDLLVTPLVPFSLTYAVDVSPSQWVLSK